MGKLKTAFENLQKERTTFVANMDHWEAETKLYLAAYDVWVKKMSAQTKLDDEILRKIADRNEKTEKADELGNIRGKLIPQPSVIKATDAQNKAFKVCDAFEAVVKQCDEILKTYDTKNKPEKEKKKVDAKKLLLEAKLDLATVKKSKLNYEYNAGESGVQRADVEKAVAEVERLKKKLEATLIKLKADVVAVDDGK